MSATDWIQAISALLAAFGIVFGVLKWLWVQQWDNAIECVGATALKKRDMGYFIVRWWSPDLWSRRIISPPVLPTISTIVKAGDIGLFTSSMIDWTLQGNDEVSWKALYEAFFRELAWRPLAPNKKYPEFIQGALDLANDSVRTIKECSSGKGASEFTDRHLLYSGIFARQYLRKCVLELPTIQGWKPQPPSDPFLGFKRNWEEYLKEAWIWKEKPSIQVSRVELIALSFILGMPLYLQKDQQSEDFVTLYGKGIYGTCIFGERGPPFEPWKLRLKHSSRDDREQDPSKGSGFATSCAMCMACGCLPFGQSLGMTHVVHVTKDTLAGIKEGCQIRDFNPNAADLSDGEKIVLSDGEKMATGYLSRLPSVTQKDSYRGCGLRSGDSGHIYDIEGKKVSEWPEVVARVAFGGLVPMAALNLVKAVRFTAQGYQELSGDDIDSVFSMLSKMVLSVQDKTEGIGLFGQYFEDRARRERKVSVNYGDPVTQNTRSATAILARFMTMLEYFTASSVNTTCEEKQIAVFNACCNELRQSYKEALTDQHPDFPIPKEKTVKYQIDEILNSNVISMRTCGQIARYIILTWTYYVSVVVWDANELRESKTDFLKEAHESRIYNACDTESNIQNLPDSYVLY